MIYGSVGTAVSLASGFPYSTVHSRDLGKMC